MSEDLCFAIGVAHLVRRYVIIEPLSGWRLNGTTPMCGHCGEVIHIGWDSPPKTGQAYCECNREDPDKWPEVEEALTAEPPGPKVSSVW